MAARHSTGPCAVAVGALGTRRAFVRYARDGPAPRIEVVCGRDAGGPPSVTIIIPTADGSRGGNLARLLGQLEHQTLQRFETIVVQGDRRQGRAINAAAAIARGDLLLILDDDSRLGHDDLLERIAGAFAAEPAIGIVGVANLIPEDAPWLMRRAMREIPRRSSAIVHRVTDSDIAEHPCLAIRRELFYRVGGEHEWIPRGLDPYLRREVRRLGYRVVVIPHAWIHHLLPDTLAALLRQYFRNGKAAAYVKRFYPEFVIDQALDHRQGVPGESHASARAVRYLVRLVGAAATLKWIYVGTAVAYGLGYVLGLCAIKEGSP